MATKTNAVMNESSVNVAVAKVARKLLTAVPTRGSANATNNQVFTRNYEIFSPIELNGVFFCATNCDNILHFCDNLRKGRR